MSRGYPPGAALCTGFCRVPGPTYVFAAINSPAGARAARAGNNHLISVLFRRFGEAEQFIGGAMSGNHFMVRDIRISKNFGGELRR